MPIRPTPTSTEEQSKKQKLEEIVTQALAYTRHQTDAAKAKKRADNINKTLKKDISSNPELFLLNGKHLETTLPVGDGVNSVFIQLQRREKISMVSNILTLLEDKLGKETLEPYLMITEVLHENALETMLNNGLITAEDIREWLVPATTESLIVTINKKTA